MDDTDTERILFSTPSLTPYASESSTSEYYDLEGSSSQRDYQQQISNLAKNLQHITDLYCQSDDIESESDAQDQQPTEATDDSNDSSQIQRTTVNIIENSLHLESAQEHDSTLPVIERTNPVEENFSTVTSDAEIVVEERHERQILTYSSSFCIPYTDEQDEISNCKEALTTISSLSLEFTGLEKKDKNNLGHIMISYNHSTRIICMKIAKYLRDHNYIVWIDQDNISGDIFNSMASAIENSFVVLMAVNQSYYESRYCRLEAEYSVEQNKAYIPMIMQSGYKPQGWLGIINGSKLHIDFSQRPFTEAFNLLLREIDAIQISLGADKNDQTIAMPVNNRMMTTTTTNHSWFHLQNIHEWTADDVIEWLNREKLVMFEEPLSNFTGATLWQLYKIKFDSATDYYRMVETLLPSTNPLRLFHNLTFNSALETLFSSSSMKTLHR